MAEHFTLKHFAALDREYFGGFKRIDARKELKLI